MFLIVDDVKLIRYISLNASRNNSGGIVVSNNLTIDMQQWDFVEVEDVPIDVVPEKYFYIDNKYVLNPNWINPLSDEEVDKLRNENTELRNNIDMLNSSNLEMSDLVLDLSIQILNKSAN